MEEKKVYGICEDLSRVKLPTIKEIIDNIYPVGSIYRSKNEINPENFLGGKWLEIYPQKTYTYIFSVVVLPNNTSVQIDTFSNIIKKFKEKYGDDYTIEDRTHIGITVSNGDDTANDTHVQGTTWSNNTLYAVFDREVGIHVRLNIAYIHIGRELYTGVHNWEREE